jgi:hypothetical protein
MLRRAPLKLKQRRGGGSMSVNYLLMLALILVARTRRFGRSGQGQEMKIALSAVTALCKLR